MHRICNIVNMMERKSEGKGLHGRPRHSCEDNM